LAKAKGTVLVDIVKALRKNKERSRTLLPAKLLHYLDERIVIASWYPLEDYVELLPGRGRATLAEVLRRKWARRFGGALR